MGISNAILKPLRRRTPSKAAASCNRGAKEFRKVRARPRCESEGNAARFIERRDRLVRAASFHRQKAQATGKRGQPHRGQQSLRCREPTASLHAFKSRDRLPSTCAVVSPRKAEIAAAARGLVGSKGSSGRGHRLAIRRY